MRETKKIKEEPLLGSICGSFPFDYTINPVQSNGWQRRGKKSNMKLIPPQKSYRERRSLCASCRGKKKIIFVASSHLSFCNLQTFYKIRSWEKLNAFIETREVEELISIFIVNKPCRFFPQFPSCFSTHSSAQEQLNMKSWQITLKRIESISDYFPPSDETGPCLYCIHITYFHISSLTSPHSILTNE